MALGADRSWIRKVSRAAFVTGAFAAPWVSMAGCDDGACEGGVVVEGVCEGKCTPDKCIENNVCVGNRCVRACSSHDECYAPARGDPTFQACETRIGDSATGLNDGDEVFVCVEIAKATNIGRACPTGAECDDIDDPDDWACPDGSPCTQGAGSPACSAAECRPLYCAAGADSVEAYCTTLDCTTDVDCGPGMYCSPIAVPNKICGTDKGEEEPCIEPSDFGKDGATFQEGPISLLRNACVTREPCASCSALPDCPSMAGLHCVEVGTERACVRECGSPEDCAHDFACTEGLCLPRSGQCTPPPQDNFCFNCTNDLQCGGPESTVACVETTGQRACFDTSFAQTCTSDEECPLSPSGAFGECMDEDNGVEDGAALYHHCYLPFSDRAGTFECWPP